MASKIITESLKEEIKQYYLSFPMSFDKVCEKFNLSRPTVGKILKDIPKYPKAKIFNPDMDERFFENIDSEQKAYFLGLIIADGNVFKDETGRQASISITLDLKDEYMLNNFKKAIKANTSIGHDGRGCGQIAIRSNLMAKDLEKYGVVPKKSNKTYLPIISDLYMPHLIRGILDGDGSIQAKLNPNDPNNHFLHSISFCGTNKLMNDINDYVFNHLNLTFKPTVYSYANKNLSDIKFQNKADIYTLGEWLYKNASIFLKRKKETYDTFKKHYNL